MIELILSALFVVNAGLADIEQDPPRARAPSRILRREASPSGVSIERDQREILIVRSTGILTHEVLMLSQETLAHITCSLVGGLVLSYIVFMGYVMSIAQKAHVEPTRTSAMGCFTFGPVAGIRPN